MPYEPPGRDPTGNPHPGPPPPEPAVVKTIYAPDSGWMPFIDTAFGYLLVIELGILALIFGVGNVKEETSFGVKEILGSIGLIGAAWAYWKFGKKNDASKQ